MKKLIFSILALGSVTILFAQKPIVIKGKIDNCPDRNNSYIEKQWFNPELLRVETITTSFPISEDGTFHIQIIDTGDYYQRYLIHFGNEYTHVDLIAGDSINMTLNGAMFDESIKYTGRGAGRNNYQKEDYLAFWERDASSNVTNQRDVNLFLEGLNTWSERKLELLNKYRFSGEIDSSYYQFEKSTILNYKAFKVLDHISIHRNHSNLSKNETAQIALILGTSDFSDDHFLQFDEFRELVIFLPSYLLEHNSIKPDVHVKSEIDFAHAHFTNLMQLYFDKKIIYKYLRQAHSLGEKDALLNFFDSQFDAPILKKEIQQQRRQIHDNRLLNSGIFQSTLFTIFGLVMLLIVLFAIIKLIQLSNNTSFKRMKINLALWLKVVFYLIVMMVSLAFISNNNDPLNGLPLVLLLLAAFLIHTYILIPKYALKRDRNYFLLVGAALIVLVIGAIISNQLSGSMYSLLVLTDLFFGMVLLSWTSFYMNQLASGKVTFRDLMKNGDLNLEYSFHLVALFLINSMFIANLRNDGRLNPILLFYAIVGLLYFHTFFTFPRFFSKEKVFQFIGINVILLLGASIVMITMDVVQSSQALKNIGVATKVSELISVRNIRLDLLLVFSLLLIPSFVYYFIKKQLMDNQSTGFKLYRKKEAELAQLRSQVNPHFLFNTLNTLYAFALTEGSEKTAECIAKLANLMRFMLDDMEKDSILLKREISYIQDYVKLQSIRSAVQHDIAITVDLEDEEGYAIAPMLLIPFVENAFKHGMNPNKVSQLKIDISAKDNRIQFVIENSIDGNFEAYYKEKGFGIGIENVKSRLKHIYPDRHTISIAKTNAKFIVILTIDLV